MEILYILVYISLGVSFGFLALFFWVVDSDQLSSLDSVPYSILEENQDTKGKEHESTKA